jgi:hypothetical protein
LRGGGAALPVVSVRRGPESAFPDEKKVWFQYGTGMEVISDEFSDEI